MKLQRTAIVVFIAVFVVSLVVALIVFSLLPKIYAAAAQVVVVEEQPTKSASDSLSAVVAAQIKGIQSERVLRDVGQRLNLPKTWDDQRKPSQFQRLSAQLRLPIPQSKAPPPFSQEEALLRLRQNLHVHQYGDTNMIVIVATDADPYLAALIANEVARSFELDLHKQQMQQIKSVPSQLLQEFYDEEMKVQRLRNKLHSPQGATISSELADTEAYRALSAAPHELEVELPRHDSMKQRVDESSKEGDAFRKRIADLIHGATRTMQMQPVRPGPWLHLILGASAGIILGMAVALPINLTVRCNATK